MIKRVVIKNIQSHRHSVFEFTNGLNVICGPSDAGKSSFIRAVLWVAKHRPLGDDYKNWYCGEEPSEVIISDGNAIVSKKREKGGTSYSLMRQGKKRITFDKVKTDVPSEIAEALDLNDYNIQVQHPQKDGSCGPYFLLADSPGEVARKLNALVGLDIIDRVFRYIDKTIHSSNQIIDIKEKDSLRIQTDIDNMAWVADADRDLASLEEDTEKYAKQDEECTELQKTIYSLEQIQTEIDSLQECLAVEAELTPLREDLAEYKILSDQILNWSNICDGIRQVDEDIKRAERFLGIGPKIKEIHTMIIEVDEANTEIRLLQDLIDQLSKCETMLNITSKHRDKSRAEYEQLVKKAGLCPMCGSALDSEAINTIMGRIQ
jgi:hypothetical protein